MVSCAAARRSGPNAALANITGAVDIEDGAGRGLGRFYGKPADCLSYFLGRGNAAERNIGDDLRSASALQIFRGHFRYGKTWCNAEAENSLVCIATRNGLGHPDHARLRRRIMPVLRTISAERGAARDVDDPSAAAPVHEMRNCETAEV